MSQPLLIYLERMALVQVTFCKRWPNVEFFSCPETRTPFLPASKSKIKLLRNAQLSTWLLVFEPSTSATASGIRALTKPIQVCPLKISLCASDRIWSSTPSTKKITNLIGAMWCGGTTKSLSLRAADRTKMTTAMLKLRKGTSLTVCFP